MTASTSESRYKDGTYLDQHQTWHAEDSDWKASQILRMINKHNLPIDRICEIGCGAGDILVNLSKNLDGRCHFCGYDISPQAIDIASSRATERINFRLGDVAALDEQSCDILLCIDVVEHIEDCFGFLRQLQKKGRFKIFHVPLEITIERILTNRIIESRAQFGHIHLFCSDTIKALLSDSGYHIVDSFLTPSGFALPPHRLGNRLARLPRKFVSLVSPELCARLLGGWSIMILAE